MTGSGVTTIPHLNDLADRFRENVVIVGISPESISKLRKFMETTEVRFSVASDRSEVVTDETTKMKDALDSESWPHCIVMSADWIVRWQGIPTGLSGKTLEKIARANRSRIDTKVETKRPRRWTQP